MANTLNLGTDGNWATKEGSLLGYNSENNNYKPLPFDFSRDSKATVINKDGLIEEVGNGQPRIDFLGNTKGALKLEPSRTNLITYSSDFPNSYWTKSGASIQGDPSTAGSELVINGDFATDSNWTKNSNTTISGGSATFVTGTASLYQSVGVTIGNTYKITYTIQSGSGSLNLSSGGFGGSTLSIPSVIGINSISVTATTTNPLYFVSIGSVNLSIDNVSVKEVQGFTSPDGSNNAFKLVEGTSNGVHQLTKNITNTVSNQYSISVFVKENTRNWIRLSSGDGGYVFFNLADNTIGIETNAFGVIEEIGNGWKRCKITFTAGGANGSATLRIAESDGVTSYVGQNKSIYVYGMQYEQGSYSTSLIKTQGTIQTRLAETCSQTVPDGVIGQTEGTVYCEVDVKSGYDENNLMITLSDTGAEQIYINRSNGKLEFFITNALVYLAPSILTNGVHKLALAYKQDDFAVAIDGVIAHTDSSGNVPTCNKINVGSHYNGNLPFNDRINDVKLYNTRLSNSELAALTQV